MQLDTIAMVATDQLTPHPFIAAIYGEAASSADFTDLVDSVRTYGVLEPVIITPDLIILSGQRRVAAAMAAGLSTVPTRTVHGLDDTAQQELILTLNQHRKRLTSAMVREALAIERLMDQGAGKHQLAQTNGHHKGSGLAARVGFRNKRLLEQARNVLLSENPVLISLMDEASITTAYRKLHRQQSDTSQFSSVIKPSDNWNFSPVRYERIDSMKESGYIPGDIYANCFWYFVKPNDLVVDPMAGSGMARHVYERRHEWMNSHSYEFQLRMFDLTPQAEDIQVHNLLISFPVNKPDYIFLDLPYLGMSKYAYSRKKEDLANMDEPAYIASIKRIAEVCATAQTAQKLCTVVSPNYTDHQQLRVINMTEAIREIWKAAGYKLHMETYASRRIQQRQHPTMAKMNNVAKERRLPLTDIVLIMTFERCS